MPNVNVKYQLTLDPTVTLNHLAFESVAFSPEDTTGKDNTPDTQIYVDDIISVLMVMSGSEGEWTIAVWVMELDDDGNQVGTDWMACAANGRNTFTDDVSKADRLQGDFQIIWK
jgi:hypothetical protein